MMSQSNYCAIKELLYPEPKKPSKNFIPRNFKQIKIIQEKNRLKKQQQQSYIDRKQIFILI